MDDEDLSGSDIDDLLADSGSEYEPSSAQSESDYDAKQSQDDKSPGDQRPRKKLKRNGVGPPRKRGQGQVGKDRRPKPRISPGAATLKYLKGVSLRKKVEKKRRMKPFRRFFDDVTIVISGFQNPKRSEIRNKALEMGACYKADWDDSCTHLVCAFANTPKYHQVKGRGKLVSKEWVEDCHSNRIRYPWRRFAIEKVDRTQSESEEEVYDGVEKSPAKVIKKKGRPKSDESDDEEIGSRARIPRQVKKELDLDPGPSTSAAQADLYEMDTDYEDEEGSNGLPFLSAIFENLKFHVSFLGEDERLLATRYIVAHNGSVTENVSEVDFFVAEDSSTSHKDLKGSRPGAEFVHYEWILRSHDENRLLPVSSYSV